MFFLRYIPILEYNASMARAATPTDVFNAIGRPRRREIIGLLNDGQDWTVSDVVARVRIAQPAVSKHLGVQRKAGVVTVVKRRQHRLYRLHAAQQKPVHDWAKTYERYWTRQLSRIKQRVEQKAMDRIARENVPPGQRAETGGTMPATITEPTVRALEIVKETMMTGHTVVLWQGCSDALGGGGDLSA
jgi:DNA-binding transcriptional ArsR family regulator